MFSAAKEKTRRDVASRNEEEEGESERSHGGSSLSSHRNMERSPMGVLPPRNMEGKANAMEMKTQKKKKHLDREISICGKPENANFLWIL